MNAWARKQTGFTIVELLIVTVVIAILAAVSIVTYNGIQKRAQQSASLSDVNSISKKIKLAMTDNSVPPTSIIDCPTPSQANICVTEPTSSTVMYSAWTSNPYNGRVADTPGYQLGVLRDRSFYFIGDFEQRGNNEFLRTVNLAPIIDKYGIVPYRLEFDIKSLDITNRTTANVYFQNGSSSKYTFGQTVPVTTSYEKQSITFTPALTADNTNDAHLAFYGLYGTGNILTVKNIRLSLVQ